MYLLPKEHLATKKILESPVQIPCDIYTDISGECAKQQVDEFMRFIECHLNKLKKNTTQRSTTRVSGCFYVFRVDLVNEFGKSVVNIIIITCIFQ